MTTMMTAATKSEDPPIFVFDIDGTLADNHHRMGYLSDDNRDWEAFFAAQPDDLPIQGMIDLVKSLSTGHSTVILQTGRPSRFRWVTTNWLINHGLGDSFDALLMRDDSDRRSQVDLKLSFLEYIQRHWLTTPSLWIDDNVEVLEVMNRQGIPTLLPFTYDNNH